MLSLKFARNRDWEYSLKSRELQKLNKCMCYIYRYDGMKKVKHCAILIVMENVATLCPPRRVPFMVHR